MFINAICGLFLTIKKFKSGKCFSSRLNFISHYKNVILRMNISRELKNCLELSLFEGAGGGEGFRNRISITSHHFASYFCLFLKLFSWQKICYDPAFHVEFWGRPFALVVWKVTRLFAPPTPPQTGGKPVGGRVKRQMTFQTISTGQVALKSKR